MHRSGGCRIILEKEPRRGSYNMALDEVLLESALRHGQTSLRWYRWSEATVSLGYFQDSAATQSDPRFARLPKVRRLSGGGAIFHHHEITYSCAVPPTHRLARLPHELYDRVHEAIISGLKQIGAEARLRGTRLDERESLFLCFARGDPRDVVVAGHKVLGSAQRRRRGAIIQHGALLLRSSHHAPEFPGLFDLTDVNVSEAQLMSLLCDSVGKSVGGELEGPCYAQELSVAERTLLAQLERERYRSLDWRRRAAKTR